MEECLAEQQRAFLGGADGGAAGAPQDLNPPACLGTTLVNSRYNFALLTNDKCVDVAAGGKVCVIQERWRAGILWSGTTPTVAWLPILGLSR